MNWESFDDVNAHVLDFVSEYHGRRMFVLVYSGKAFVANCSNEDHILNFEDFLALFNQSSIKLVGEVQGRDVVFSEEIQSLLNYDDFLLDDLRIKMLSSTSGCF